jgi:CTP:molybdopterin cytidylyltransferase MocA
MIPIHGRPMAQWVLDAVSRASSVVSIVIVGLSADDGLHSDKQIVYVPDAGGILENVLGGIEKLQSMNPSAEHALVVASDIPALTSEMVQWRIDTAQSSDADLNYIVIPRSTMEARFPEARRTYVRLKDAEVCGGDINIARLALARNEELWGKLVQARKSVVRQAALLGFDLLLLLLLRQITLLQAQERVSQRLGVKGVVTISPFAEVGMDVDKPEQVEILQKHLARPDR